jgi:hypothetical protein
VAFDLRVGDQVGPVPGGVGVFGVRQQECAGLGELVGVPARREGALAEDEVDVAAFADAQADPHVHLGPDGGFAHRVLGRPLGGGDQVDRDRPAAPGDGVGVLVGEAGQFGVLVYLCGCPHRWIYADAAAMPRGFVCGFLLAW